MSYPRFVIVIHPDSVKPDTIFYALSEQRAVALNILPYRDWLSEEISSSHDLLYIQQGNSWRYAKSTDEKLAIRGRLEALAHTT